ncbi:hypothetical protein R1sor_000568 [Riccia sorocarpa]|uniref:Uncharacterized protein n=1 Tax=Riccia sorocarpa TaxID=122646 RepID=A0ABD3GVE4_9MARC
MRQPIEFPDQEVRIKRAQESRETISPRAEARARAEAKTREDAARVEEAVARAKEEAEASILPNNIYKRKQFISPMDTRKSVGAALLKTPDKSTKFVIVSDEGEDGTAVVVEQEKEKLSLEEEELEDEELNDNTPPLERQYLE